MAGDEKALHLGAHEGNEPQEFGGEEGSGLSFAITLGLEIGTKLDEHTRQLKSLNDKLQQNTPVFYATASQVVGNGSTATINLGTPDRGTQWEVNFLAIGGLDLNVAAAGTAGVYVTGNGVAGGNTGGMTNVQDYAAALPKVDFYSQKQFIVNEAEYLIIQIFGSTNLQTYVANAQITVYDLQANSGRTVITE